MTPGFQGLMGRWSLNSRGTEQKGLENSLKKAQLVVASPFEVIVALMKADVSPVVTAGAIKLGVLSLIPKDT